MILAVLIAVLKSVELHIFSSGFDAAPLNLWPSCRSTGIKPLAPIRRHIELAPISASDSIKDTLQPCSTSFQAYKTSRESDW